MTETTSHYDAKRKFLKNYIQLKRKLFKINPKRKRYSKTRHEMLQNKREFYSSKIDDMKENWNNYNYCPGLKHLRAIKGLVKTLNELNPSVL